MDPILFTTILSGNASGPTGIVVPAEIIDQLAAGKKPAVDICVNGYEYKSTVGVMNGMFMIPFSSEHRTKSGIKAGDTIAVNLAVDTLPRTIVVPSDLAAALATAGKSDEFEKLAPSHRKEHVRSVDEAKTVETRVKRIEKVISALQAKV